MPFLDGSALVWSGSGAIVATSLFELDAPSALGGVIVHR